MKLIKSSVQLLEQASGIEGIYKQIELAGRTCYKSEDKITETSAKEFVDRMIKSGHGAMLEHGTVYLYIPKCNNTEYKSRKRRYRSNKYSKITISYNRDLKTSLAPVAICVTTNLRVLVENNWLDDLKYLCEPTERHIKRIACRFICDRGVSHEFVRHRVFSFAQESQRFCNYSKDKFDSQITFVKPHWFPNGTIEELKEIYLNNDNQNPAKAWMSSLIDAESKYASLLSAGLKSQDARSVLPNATKTELVMTGFEDDWQHFFNLRCAPNAHPDAQKLANELKNLVAKRNNRGKLLQIIEGDVKREVYERGTLYHCDNGVELFVTQNNKVDGPLTDIKEDESEQKD